MNTETSMPSVALDENVKKRLDELLARKDTANKLLLNIAEEAAKLSSVACELLSVRGIGIPSTKTEAQCVNDMITKMAYLELSCESYLQAWSDPSAARNLIDMAKAERVKSYMSAHHYIDN